MDDSKTDERKFKKFETRIMKDQFIPYGHQWINNQDIKEVVKVLKTDWITQGPKVEEFEKAVAKYSAAKYAVAVSSGSAALQAAYKIAGVKKGDEIITTPLTFAASCNTFIDYEGKPVFVDIDKNSLNIDHKKIEEKINSKTKIITTVDFAGYPCEYDKILKIAKKYNLLVIEDASHAIGSKYKNRKIGSIADMTIFSFHPVKTITTGEGGMVLTNNKKLYEQLRIVRHHGIVKKPERGDWYYEIKEPGTNLRITDFQSALGLSQLRRIDKFIKRREQIVKQYNQAFKNIPEMLLFQGEKNRKTVFHLYVIQLKLNLLKVDRKQFFGDLRKQGLGVQVHYIPLHLQPFYKKKFGYKKGDFPITEEYYKRAISLPLFPKMSDKEVKRVIKTLKKTIKLYRK